MKRQEIIRKLESFGCFLKRNGANHDIYYNPKTNKSAPVPRHKEIPDSLYKLILKQLNLSD